MSILKSPSFEIWSSSSFFKSVKSEKQLYGNSNLRFVWRGSKSARSTNWAEMFEKCLRIVREGARKRGAATFILQHFWSFYFNRYSADRTTSLSAQCGVRWRPDDRRRLQVRVTQFLMLQISLKKTASSTRTAYWARLIPGTIWFNWAQLNRSSGSISPPSLRYTIWMLHPKNKLNVLIQMKT